MSAKEEIEDLFGGEAKPPKQDAKKVAESAEAAKPSTVPSSAPAKQSHPQQAKPEAKQATAAKPAKKKPAPSPAAAPAPQQPVPKKENEVVIRISDFTDEPEPPPAPPPPTAEELAKKGGYLANPALPPVSGTTSAQTSRTAPQKPTASPVRPTASAVPPRPAQPSASSTQTPPPRNQPRTVDKNGQPIKKVVSMKKSILEKSHYVITEADEPTILEGLEQHLTLTTIAKMVGCCRGTLVKYIRSKSLLTEAANDTREEFDDLVEQKLFEKIDNGDLNAIFFYMQRRMRGRGYGDHQVVEQQGDTRSIVIGHVAVPKEMPDYTKAIAEKMEKEGVADPAAMEIAAEAAAASAAQVEQTPEAAAAQAQGATVANETATPENPAKETAQEPLPEGLKKKSVLEELEEAERNLPKYGSPSDAEQANAASAAASQPTAAAPATAPASIKPPATGPQTATRRVPQDGYEEPPPIDQNFGFMAGGGMGGGSDMFDSAPTGDFDGMDGAGFFDGFGGGAGLM